MVNKKQIRLPEAQKTKTTPFHERLNRRRCCCCCLRLGLHRVGWEGHWEQRRDEEEEAESASGG